MTNPTDCIFCQIANQAAPCHQIYQDELFIAFLNIRPLAKGHTLLIPKIHYRWIYDLPNIGKYFEIAQLIAFSQLNKLKCQFVTFLTVGRQVPHAHLHLIPRYPNDPHQEGIDVTKGTSPTNEELSTIANSLKL